MAAEYFPEVLAGAGYAVGLAAEWRAQVIAGREQKPIADALAKTAPKMPVPPAECNARRVCRVLNNRGISFIAALTAATGAFAGLAVQEANPHQAQLPLIEVGVDHSGATAGVPARHIPADIDQINNLALGLGATHGLDAEAIISSGGNSFGWPISEVAKDAPIGQSKMNEVTQSAIGNISQALSKKTSPSASRNAAIFIITNGNSIGDPKTVTDQANLSKQKLYIPIYIANVESESDATTTSSLKQIATSTGGHYWNIGQAQTGNVAKEIKDTVSSYSAPDGGQNQEVFDAVMAGFCLGLSGVAFKRRQRMPINRGLKASKGTRRKV